MITDETMPMPVVPEHPVTPLKGLVYSWASNLVTGEAVASDYPLIGFCAACCAPVICRAVGAPWEHKPPGELINSPTEPEF